MRQKNQSIYFSYICEKSFLNYKHQEYVWNLARNMQNRELAFLEFDIRICLSHHQHSNRFSW